MSLFDFIYDVRTEVFKETFFFSISLFQCLIYFEKMLHYDANKSILHREHDK